MADLLKSFFGGAQDNKPVPAKSDSDFADFAGAPEPIPEAAPSSVSGSAAAATATQVPWTKWYNVHERHSLSEFRAEGFVLVVALFVVFFHIFGARINRNKAESWARAHAPILAGEYAIVGFGGVPTVESEDLELKTVLKEKSLYEFSSYATGRQNTAFMDIRITLVKRFNPLMALIETGTAFFFESYTMPADIVEAAIYPFDGKEALTVPELPGSNETRAKDGKSAYDGFVWAVVNKSVMQGVRAERYDVSLTTTKDNAKLPDWLTVMTESAEITSALLTDDLVSAIKLAGNDFHYLIVTDQPMDKPKTLEENNPNKRIFLKYQVPSGSYDPLLPLFSYFQRLPDSLVQTAHFRPEVMKKVRATRENMIKDIRKVADEQVAEERLLEKEKAKKVKRDAELKGLDAKQQKKYLEKEKEKEMRKSQKRSTQRA